MTLSNPEITFNILSANEAVKNGPQQVLFVGQMLTGSATAGELQTNIGNQNEWDTLFGKNSMLAGMIRAFRKINKVTRIDAIPLADASGDPAVSTIVFSGTATADGTLYVTVGSYKNHRYQLDVTTGDTAADVAAALAAAIQADTYCPFSGASSTVTTTITAEHDGTEYNGETVRVQGTVAGITFTVNAFASGATNPTLTNIFDVVADTRYQTVVWPKSYAVANVTTSFLEDRFNANNIILDGIALQTMVDSYADHITALNALNQKSLVPVVVPEVTDTYWKGNAIQEFGYVLASQAAALRSLRLTEGANITNIVTVAASPLDVEGGPALGALPYFNTPVANLQPIEAGKNWSAIQAEGIITAGGSVIGNNRTNTNVVLGEMVTTYKTDAAGNSDPTFKFLNNVDVATIVREYFFNNLKDEFAQARLTEGDLIPGRSIHNDRSISAFMDQLYSDLASTDYVLVQKGEAARKFFKENKTVTLDLATGKVTINMQVPIVTQLREIVVNMQIAFTTT